MLARSGDVQFLTHTNFSDHFGRLLLEEQEKEEMRKQCMDLAVPLDMTENIFIC